MGAYQGDIMKKLIVGMCLAGLSMVAMADDAAKQARPGVKAALEECKAQGRPGDGTFATCMEGKGFKKPEKRQDGEHGHRVMPAGLKEAMEACRTAGKPRDPAFESCMLEKGYKKPAGLKEHQGKDDH